MKTITNQNNIDTTMINDKERVKLTVRRYNT